FDEKNPAAVAGPSSGQSAWQPRQLDQTWRRAKEVTGPFRSRHIPPLKFPGLPVRVLMGGLFLRPRGSGMAALSVATAVSATVTTNLGYLTILRDGTGYLGGYLVTNAWGRPLEFRLSSAVQPNRVQQILYGQSLEPY